MTWRVPLCRPTFVRDDLEAMLETYRSGWLTSGPRTAELEEAFAHYTRARHAIAVSSCSAALHLACDAARLRPGDEVVVPSLTFTSTVNAITHVGARPRFADIADVTEPWLSVESVEAAIGPRTKAVLTMAYGGHLGETEAIGELAARHDLILIEDAAHACGSWLGERHAGTFGLAGAFSFSGSKNIGIGEGGMLITDDDEFAARVARRRWHGLSSQAWDRHHQATPKYELADTGFNYRLDDPKAALAHAMLGRLDSENARRAAIDAAYREAFAGMEPIRPTAAPDPQARSSHCMFTAVLDEAVDRDRFRAALADRGVQTSVHYPPVHLGVNHAQAHVQLPLTEDYARRSVTLPLFPQMTAEQRELVIGAVRESLVRPVRAASAA
jgi:dTDP-4-amino-4,6-dideoxygalactose transaminase